MADRGPRALELRGELIVLRRFDPSETVAAWRGLASLDEIAHPRRTPDDRAPVPSARFRRGIARSGRLWRGQLLLAIDRRGRLVGQIEARTGPKHKLPARAFEIGVALYRVRDRGKGYGGEAVRLLVGHLFGTGVAERIQAGTGADNAAMRAVLEREGFRLEGIMRGAGALSDGTRVDGALYAILRGDQEARPGV